jgi:hydroxymethylpyrimidine/phosphomethylpyrimidine kinase
MNSPEPTDTDAGTAVPAEEPPAPACVMSFNASDASGAGGSAGDISTIAAMGAHTLPVITSIVMRDSAEIFDQHPIDPEQVAEQARTILEDVTLAAWKVGFLGDADNVAAVAEVLSDYPDVPLVASRTSCCPSGTANGRRRRASSRSRPVSTARASCW